MPPKFRGGSGKPPFTLVKPLGDNGKSPDEEARALELHQTALKRRAERCMSRLKAVLIEERCRVVGVTHIFYDGRTPVMEWDVEALP